MAQIRKELPQGKWRNTRLFEDVSVAAEHDMIPSQLWQLSDGDQALLIAHSRASGTIRAYSDFLHQKAMDAAAKRKR